MMGGGVKHIKLEDGTVWSINYCECGKILYKKNLKTGQIQIVTGGKTPFLKYSYLEVPGNPSQFNYSCSNCNRESLIVSVSETMGIQEEISLA